MSSPAPGQSLIAPSSFTFERVARFAFAAMSLAIGAAYAATIAYLLLKGGKKALSFTFFAMPSSGVPGEERLRWVLAPVTGALFGWLAFTAGVHTERFLPKVAAFCEKNRKFAVLGGAVFAAVALRDHLPRFLVAFPSETRAGGGAGPEIFNTLYFAVLSTLVTFPVGVGAAIYLARFTASKSVAAAVRTALDTLASLPSIVYGLFGFLIFVVHLKAGYSLLSGALVLGILNLPLVVGIAEESLQAVPRDLEDASLAVGGTLVQTVFRVTVPYAWPGIMSAIVLSIGRVFAESAPLIMTAGTTVSRTNAYSFDAMRGGETLSVHLWYVNSAGLSPNRVEISAATAAILVVLVMLTNMLAAELARFGGALGTRTKKITGKT